MRSKFERKHFHKFNDNVTDVVTKENITVVTQGIRDMWLTLTATCWSTLEPIFGPFLNCMDLKKSFNQNMTQEHDQNSKGKSFSKSANYKD